MISNDQDAVAKKAQDATTEDLEYARLEDLAASDTLDLDALDAKTILALPTGRHYRMDHNQPGWAKAYDRSIAIESAQEQVRDEIAFARVLARRGELPDTDWPHDDPRRDAWRDVLWALVKQATRAIDRASIRDKRPATRSPEFTRVASAFDEASSALGLLQREDNLIHGR